MEDPSKKKAVGQGDAGESADHDEVHVVDADADAGAQPADESAPTHVEAAHPAAAAEEAATVEAILFATDAPLTPAKIAQVAELPARAVKQAIESLNARYEQAGSAFRIEAIAGGFQMFTQPEYHDVLKRLLRVRSDSKLSQAAMDALAIIAYRQPVLRADVEAIRGVACGELLRGLMEKQLVKIVGRAEVLGRPMLYGTTRRFLEVFGLNGLEDLPRVEELRSGAPDKGKSVPPPGGQPPDGKGQGAEQGNGNPLPDGPQSAHEAPATPEAPTAPNPPQPA